MYTIFNCLAYQHDWRLVALSNVICLLASFAAISLLHHVGRSKGRMRVAWLAVAATATGFGIWSTHFIAMLAFSPGIAGAYNITLTFLSLVAAILLTGWGLAVAIATPSSSQGRWLGGAIVGGGIAAMHYTGMAAFEIQGRIAWDTSLVVVSIALGGLIGSAALPAGLRSEGLKWKLLGALLLALAIISHHFTAMGAASVIPDPTIEISDASLPSGFLAIAVAFASFVTILLALAGVAIEMRDRRRLELEAERMRGLANAAVEGLLVCDGETIVTVNDSFAALAGAPAGDLVGAKLGQFFPDETVLRLWERPDHPVESDLLHPDGSLTPAEVILRPIDFAGKPLHAIAVRDLRARKQAEQHIRFLAHHDILTGLPNRSTFNERLDQEIERALAGRRQFAVLCLNLDRFKQVNDLFGHAIGDKMLQVFTRRIAGMLDDSQLLARLSGDEFAIILPSCNPARAGRFAAKILEDLRAASEKSETNSPVSVSIGIAMCPQDATDRHTLLTHADTALHRAKNEGRGTYRYFEASMGSAGRDRRMLEHDLPHAISRGELRLVYQPQKNVRSKTIVGFEALLRWKHPQRGEISPLEFIPIAEETGVIRQIGEWVLRMACREAATWSQPLTIAVNVSTKQIHSPNFAHALHEILFETGLSPGRLELEITETALIQDLPRALATLRRVKMLGVRIAMDDFGTGYSSLSNLRAFPFDKIKIDGSFIKSVNINEQAATIVRAVLGLGRGLKLPVLAEGVETAAELEFLEKELCDEAQGYLLGRPADIASFRAQTHGVEADEARPNVIALVTPAASSM